MFIAFRGTVKKKLKGKHAQVSDHHSGDLIEVVLEGDDSFDLKTGASGVFVGEYRRGSFYIKRFDMRKFINPIYEKSILKQIGTVTFHDVIDNPFPEIYHELRLEQEANKNDETEAEQSNDSPAEGRGRVSEV